MPLSWTVEQILSMAPDTSSAKSGKELANPRKWVSLGCNDASAWGECQGSGSSPYQTQIDLSEPAFKCSCPSRKFPCKHSLGLFLLLASQAGAFTQDSPPAWVEEWLAGRTKRAEQKAAKKEEKAESASDPEAQVKRAAQREAKVAAGIGELDTWLKDMVRNGLAGVEGQPYSYWDVVAARMVDAQAPGIARMLRETAGISPSGVGWQERLLERLSKLYLLIEGYKRLDSLPPPVQADIRAQIGWTQNQEELVSGDGIRDSWHVLAQRVYEEDRLRVQRTWLWGQNSGRPALVLNFTHSSQPMMDVGLVPGSCVDAELVFYPGAFPLRALVKDRSGSPVQMNDFPGVTAIDALLEQYASALAANPWIESYPVSVKGIVPAWQSDELVLSDSSGGCVPLAQGFSLFWELLSISGGYPIAVFGEWDGYSLLPLSVWADGRFYTLTVNGGLG